MSYERAGPSHEVSGRGIEGQSASVLDDCPAFVATFNRELRRHRPVERADPRGRMVAALEASVGGYDA